MVGRNEPCHCGSGKKYKKCCLAKDSNLVVLTGQKGISAERANLTPDQLEAARLLDINPDAFYADDLTLFYLEKTKGKAKATVNKYRNSIETIGLSLSGHEDAFSWSELRPDFWEQIIVYDFFLMTPEPSYHQIENLFSVLKQFAKWTDKKYGWDNEEFVKFIVDKNQHGIMDSIYSYHYLLRQVLIHNAKDKFFGIDSPHIVREERGWFVVEDMTTTTIKTTEFTGGDTFTITIPKEMLSQDAVHYGMIFAGVINKERGKRNCKFVKLDNVYPPKAFPYLKEEVSQYF